MKIFFIFLFLLLPLTARAEVIYEHSRIRPKHPEWLACQADDQCVIVKGHTCDYKLAVNKNYASRAEDSVETIVSCDKPFTYPPAITPKCINGECVIAIPYRSTNPTSAIPSPPPGQLQ